MSEVVKKTPEPDINELPTSFSFGMEFKSVVKKLKEYGGSVYIICHNDADGLCGGAVLAKTLARAGFFFRLRSVPGLDENIVEELVQEAMDFYIFVDLGSGYVELVEHLCSRTGSQVVVLDHHKIERATSRFLQVNCNNHGIDGSFDMSGSMMAFVLAVSFDMLNYDLVDVALAGAVGDKQNINGFGGLNKAFAQQACKYGFLRKEQGVDIRGGNILGALDNTFDPFFKGLSGRPSAITKFLTELGIPGDISLDALDEQKKKYLNSALLMKMIEAGSLQSSIRNFARDRYYSPRLHMFIDELATVVNACGKMAEWSLALAYILDSANYSTEANDKAAVFNRKILKKLAQLEEGFQQRDHFQYFTGEEGDHCGTVAGIAIRYLSSGEYPLLGLTTRKNKIDISARGTRALVAGGLDLASAMSQVSLKVGGMGGGHPVASGASIPPDKMDEFLTELDVFLSDD